MPLSSEQANDEIESGDACVSPDLLLRSLLAIGTPNKELAKVIAGSQINTKAA